MCLLFEINRFAKEGEEFTNKEVVDDFIIVLRWTCCSFLMEKILLHG
jgi:hypothetical protein